MTKREDRIKVLRELLKEIERLRVFDHEHPDFKKWYDKAKRQLRHFYADYDWVIEFENIQFCDLLFRMERIKYHSDQKFFEDGLNKAENILNQFIQWEEEKERNERKRRGAE